MRSRLALLSLCVMVATGVTAAQTRRATRPAAPPVPPKKEAPEVVCPTPLGSGQNTKRQFCDVFTGRDPAAGIVITIPPHKGDVTLTFDLHNRHTYSEEQMRDPRVAFTRYTASIGALTMDNTLVSRAAVQSEFRTTADFFDRVSGGAGPSGLKAVAPTGNEPITLTIPEAEEKVSILGEKLMVERAEGSATYTSAGRPIAIISNLMIEYRPLPPAPAPRATPPRTTQPAPARRPAPGQ